MAKKVIRCLLVLLTIRAVAAQDFTQVGREAVSRGWGKSWTRLVDLDGDGALDLLFGESPRDLFFRNDGRGRFTPRPIAGPTAFVNSPPALGDFDGDGDRDAFAVLSVNGIPAGYVLHNRGALAPEWLSTSLVSPAIAVGDFNGDGRSDLVIDSGVAIATSLTSFQTVPVASISREPAVADVDGDGDLDLVCMRATIQLTLGGQTFTLPGGRFVWRNDGAGAFTVLSPFVGATPIAVGDALDDLLVLDADGDGDFDCGFLRNGGFEFWRNQGNGAFTAWGGPAIGSAPLDLADLDRDGDPDLIGRAVWFENLGLGSFVARSLPAMDAAPQAIGDVDGDLDVDLVLAFGINTAWGATMGERRLLLNQGAQGFVDVTAPAWQRPEQLPYHDSPIVFGDVDGDTFPDLIGMDGTNATLWRNGGDGWFTAGPGPVLLGLFVDPQLVDLDGDGDLDFVSEDWAAINNGIGSFVSLPLPIAGLSASWWVRHAFDADGDGDIDLLGWEPGTAAPVLLRNQGMVFSATPPVAVPAASIEDSEIADFDGDGDIDLLLGLSSPASIALLRNDGSGAFSFDPAGVSGAIGSGQIRNLAIGDLDGDADCDVLVGRFGGGLPRQHMVLRNNGGVLVLDPVALPSLTAYAGLTPGGSVRLGDVDGDGDLDAALVVANGAWYRVLLCTNNGSGTFAVGPDGPSAPLSLLDVDRDGDADWVGSERLYSNRHLHFEAPFVAQIGTTYRFRCGGSSLPNSLALPCIGVRTTLSLPGLGTIGLDPLTAMPLPWLVMNGDLAEGAFAIPAVPTLVGSPFSLQVLLLAANGVLRITPAKHEVVRS